MYHVLGAKIFWRRKNNLNAKWKSEDAGNESPRCGIYGMCAADMMYHVLGAKIFWTCKNNVNAKWKSEAAGK